MSIEARFAKIRAGVHVDRRLQPLYYSYLLLTLARYYAPATRRGAA